MPRRGIIKKRKTQPDSFYNSTTIQKFINLSLKEGKKTTAERVIYNAMEIIKAKTKEDPLKAVEKAVENARPVLETKSRRVGGATYQVPIEVPIERSTSVAVRWLLGFRPGAERKKHGGEAGRRDHGRHGQPGRRDQEERGHAQDGGGQPGLRSL